MVHISHCHLQRLCEARASDTAFPGAALPYRTLSISVLQTQLLPSGLPSACQMARTAAPAGSRSSTRTSGERCAMTTGTWRMLAWCAGSWAAAWRCQPPRPGISAQGPVPSGWTTSAAPGWRSPCLTAGRRAGERTTATTAKMPAWCAQVTPRGNYGAGGYDDA